MLYGGLVWWGMPDTGPNLGGDFATNIPRTMEMVKLSATTNVRGGWAGGPSRSAGAPVTGKKPIA